MRKIIVTLMASLLSCSVASAFWPEATDSSLEIGVGYRNDSLKWKTKSDFGGSSYGSGYDSYDDDSYGASGAASLPTITSKLDWKNLNIWQIEGRGRYITCDCIYLRGSADYGWITSGKNTDKDYIALGSGSALEFASSSSHVKGHVYDVKLAVGYQFRLCDDTFAIAPLIGYSWHGQHFSDSHLKQHFPALDGNYGDYSETRMANLAGTRSYYDDDYYYSGDYDYSSSDSFGYSTSYGGNHSKYHARWNGIFLGFDFDYTFGCCCDWTVFGSYEFHWSDYHARAHWNLRPDLSNGFNHHAKNAYGQVFDIGVKWDFCDCWTIALRGEFMCWWADHGHDRAKIDQVRVGDVKKDSYVKVPLRDVRWDSAAVTVDLGMVF